MMNKPVISERFDIDDIRAIRTYNAERYKHMSAKEIVEDTKKGADRVYLMLDPKRAKRVPITRI